MREYLVVVPSQRIAELAEGGIGVKAGPCENIPHLEHLGLGSKTLIIHVIYDTTNKQKGYDEQSIILCLKGSKKPIYFVLKANLND